jgi:hydroxylamine reductase
MGMFCFQCQETVKNTGCTRVGVCGKTEQTSNLQDLLLHVVRGISLCHEAAASSGIEPKGAGRFVSEALFVTITNVDFDDDDVSKWIEKALAVRDELKRLLAAKGVDTSAMHDSVTWSGPRSSYAAKATEVGILSTEDEDIRSLRSLLLFGLKGVAAYAHHAAVLGREDSGIYGFLMEGMASTTRDLGGDQLVGMVLRAGEAAVNTMALLDAANTGTYGDPEITEVSTGVRGNPGILISGHDLRDLEQLLEQTAGTGVDVYTHGEMLPAHYYPAFKKYPNLAGNYGGSWYAQKEEFEPFNGPILMTTNCLVPPRDSYRDRLFTTGVVAFPGVTHVDPDAQGRKDFSAVIALAKTCAPPKELENGTIVGGFAHAQILALADKVVDAVKSGAIRKFIVMAGCDGRLKSREYFTEVARQLPEDTVILTAGCAKYRYIKLPLGDIGGIPRVLDAGQCNDSYSLAVTALKLKEVFGLADVNDLPIEFDIAWYEQKAVAVLLALLHLGFKDIRLGPTLPAFLSPGVAKVLVETFGIKATTDAAADVAAMAG